MKKLFFITTVIIMIHQLHNISFAQNPDIKRTYHWYFGYGAGLDFSSGSPVAVTDGAMFSNEGCASISDTSGNLLFYTDGDTVWNRNHLPMPNGTGLVGCNVVPYNSSSQGALIVPYPGNNNQYYIFTTDCGAENSGANGCHYNIVDMTLDGGLGDILSSKKNILLFAPSSEHLVYTKTILGDGYWVISRVYGSSNEFLAYKVTSTSIDTTPVISAVDPPSTIGCLKVSPDGKKIALGAGTSTLFDFDNNTGIVSNPIPLPNWQDGAGNPSIEYGVSFSPDNKLLYTTGLNVIGTPYGKVFQYDLTSGDSLTICNSKIELQSSFLGYYTAQIGPDGKIYIARAGKDSLGVINAPNSAGLSCNYVDAGIYLNTKISMGGLPNFRDDYFNNLNASQPEILICKDDISVYPNPFSSFTNIIIPCSLNIEPEIIVYDIVGQEVQGFKYTISKDDITINNNNVSAGIYFIQIKSSEKVFTQKLILTNQN